MVEDATGERTNAERPARLRDAFAVGEFQALWLAHAQSRIGDQLARVALAVLVYDRTQSAAWTALTYAMTILPNLAGGALLAGFADRFDRRAVLVVCDVARAVLVAAMVLPGLPIAALVVLLCLAQLPFAPFSAARSGILPAVLPGERYLAGLSVLRGTDQLGLVGGIAAGAALVAALGTHTTLAVDAATFGVSALLLRFGVRPHRPPDAAARSPGVWWRSLRAGFALVTRDPRLRALVGLACVNGFYVVPESLAVPYAARIGGGTGAVGVLLAAVPAGTVLGLFGLQRLRPELRLRLLGPLAVTTCALLVPSGWAPGLAVSALLWGLSGLAAAHDVVVQGAFVRAAPDASLGQAVGLAGAAMQAAQGAGIVLGGLLAQAIGPAPVVGWAGAAGVLAAAAATLAWHRARRSAAG